MLTEETNVREVAANLYRIRLPMPFDLNHINVYLLKETNRLALVDCGLNDAPSWAALTAGLANLGLEVGELTDIFVTHSHPDHIGLCNKLRQAAPDARLFFHEKEYSWLKSRATATEAAIQYLHGWLLQNGVDYLDPVRLAQNGLDYFPALQPQDVLLDGGERIQLEPADTTAEWQVQWTPGHTAGHFVLYSPERRLLLSGDHLLHSISSNIGKYPGSTEDPLGEYISSLQAIARLDIAEVLPAHGEVFSNHSDRVATLIHHHEERLAKIHAALEKEPRTAAQVVYSIWGDRLKGFNQYLALVEVLSHLERLKRDGRVVLEEGPVHYYRAA